MMVHKRASRPSPDIFAFPSPSLEASQSPSFFFLPSADDDDLVSNFSLFVRRSRNSQKKKQRKWRGKGITRYNGFFLVSWRSSRVHNMYMYTLYTLTIVEIVSIPVVLVTVTRECLKCNIHARSTSSSVIHYVLTGLHV